MIVISVMANIENVPIGINRLSLLVVRAFSWIHSVAIELHRDESNY